MGGLLSERYRFGPEQVPVSPLALALAIERIARERI
jgi:hypothetical protein